MHLVNLPRPGAYAELRDTPTISGRETFRAAFLILEAHFARLYPGVQIAPFITSPPPAGADGPFVQAWVDLRSAAILAHLTSWTLGEPLPAPETMGTVEAPVWDALAAACLPLAFAALVASVPAAAGALEEVATDGR